MRLSRIAAVAAGVAVSTLVLAGCAGDASPAAETTDDGPVRVVVLGGIGAEGILADNATTAVTAALASVDAVNEMGGILDREVVIEVIDDTADPTVAVTKLRELFASDEKPHFVMNSGPSTITEAMLPILTQNKVVSFNIGPTETSGDPTVYPYSFNLSASVPDYIHSFVTELDDKGYEDIAILHGSSAYGESFGAMAEKIFTEEGFTVTDMEGFDNAALDMTAQLEALRQSDPDALVLDAYGAPLGYVLQGLDKLGWDVPVIGNSSVAATGLIATEPPAGVLGTPQVANLTMQVYTSTQFDPNDTTVNEAVERMLAAGDIKSSLILAYNYDSMLLIKAAAEAAGSLDPDEIVKALVDPEVQAETQTAILGNYAFTADEHSPHVAPSDFKFIPPGKLVNGQYQP
ncbi:ABC transporter substrate-binding protein [Microbacterium sp. zg.Y1090]|uniref:ABC transporter substrate-binding protein n=1 Tax=Microbacterium TaxID=33882 RepID=UPI00214CB2A9|nr:MULTISPECIES: ABC transporter substrate-binding protein [unclassified Microbacterium]MCR2813312.1 ABC transporter substrate-binding protein [Microbacterium sp. zg.Y1084]MCR2819854.1 ABC transporter substrate-binding protein [Microbacterium sp. zg.Y1090]MDL5487965.1 ABC transporter substrate-binding protein [Microbacterium sp. zg-Y1211]WIM28589.1 ABC transporter substrate-binding protein [Microbacterium sp. zg-Y1090]